MNVHLKETGPVFLMLAVAAVLRFWNIHTLEYHYDELSAILRALGAQTWQEHIRNGVLPDGHPAGIQTLIRFTGDHVTILKSMAALAGTLAVYFVYRTGLILFQPAAAIAAALLLAISYPAVFWSQQIRPYAFGLCAATAMLWIAAQIVIEKKRDLKRYVYFGIAAAACSYIHYFSGLFALLTMTFVWIFTAENLKYNLTSWTTAAVLFLPHIPVTIHQLDEGGLGWLSRPSASFFSEHLYQLFNHSRSFMAIALIPVFTGILVLRRNRIKSPAGILWVLFALFAMPLLIGFFYSIWRAPVLQHSVLLFSTPPLLLILGYFISHLPVNIFRVQLLLILIWGIAVIILDRKHYSKVYQEPYSSAVKYMASHPQQHYVADIPKDIFEYYLRKFDPQGQIKYRYLLQDNEPFSFRKAREMAEIPGQRLVVSSGSHPGLLPIVEDLTGNLKFSDPETTWIGVEIPQFDYYLHDNRYYTQKPWPYKEFRTSRDIPLKVLNPGPTDVVVIRYPFQNTDSAWESLEIQSSITCGDKQTDWRSTKAQSSKDARLAYAYHFIKLADIPGWNLKCKLRVELSGHTGPDHIQIRLSKGNPLLYGIP